MNLKFSWFKLIQNQVRFLSKKSSRGHYESLGISSNSTQNEIKSAYYKLSMMYHPDKNQGNEEHSKRFRDITEAYEILGNVKTRKLYDKGFYYEGPKTIDDKLEKFHRSRETRSRPPPPTGRTPIYDFDEWSKNHYGATFQKSMELKRKQRIRQMDHEHDINHAKLENTVLLLGAIAFVLMILASRNDHDSITTFNDAIISTTKKKNE